MAREEFRRRIQFPVPSILEIEARLHEVLSPALLDPRQRSEPALQLRNRILTLPVMVAIVLSLVWRQAHLAGRGVAAVGPGGSVVDRGDYRLATSPVQAVGDFACLLERTRQGQARPWPKELEPLREHFPALWVADGSTLEALWKRVAALRDQQGHPLAGKLFMLVDLATHLPIHWHYHPDQHTNEKTIAQRWLAQLPLGGLLVFDLGLYGVSGVVPLQCSLPTEEV